MRAHNISAAAAALLLLEVLVDDPNELEYLCVTGDRFDYDPPYEVKNFVAAQDRGYNIYIIKYRDDDDHLLPYRLFVGFHAQKDTYYALALTSRENSYDLRDDAFRALRDRYEQCGIPTYR